MALKSVQLGQCQLSQGALAAAANERTSFATDDFVRGILDKLTTTGAAEAALLASMDMAILVACSNMPLGQQGIGAIAWLHCHSNKRIIPP